MTSPHIHYEERDQIATITIDRPMKRNALSIPMIATLRECWKTFDEGDARVAILRSSDPSIFSAGADLNDPAPDAWRIIPEVGFKTDKPIIAAVSGKAIGLGFLIVAMCDLCVMSEDASLVYPEAKLGFALGVVSTLARRIPPKIALEIMLLGEPINARRAYEVGLANRVVPSGMHLDEARKLATILTENAPLVLTMLKRMSMDALGASPIQNSFDVIIRGEAVMQSEDTRNALEAFKRKEKPVFKGR